MKFDFVKRITLLTLCSLFVAQAAAVDVRINYTASGPREQWPLDVLNMAFSYDKSETYNLVQLPEEVNQARLRNMVAEGSLDLMWVGTKPDIEQNFRPIRVPLFKGLLGHRIFIIRKGDQARFSQVRNFGDLLKLEAGQGRFWGDTQILESAGIPVVKPVNYPNLFHMLDGERFDYFPRAVHEPWSEVASRPELNLTIETELMLIYPMPLYFFTNINNEGLARAIESGLNKGIDDGTFDRMFFGNPDIKSALDRTNMKARRVFRIDNPSLSPATPLNDKRLWVDIETL